MVVLSPLTIDRLIGKLRQLCCHEYSGLEMVAVKIRTVLLCLLIAQFSVSCAPVTRNELKSARVHVVERDGIQKFVPASVYDGKKFETSENIHARQISRLEGQQVLLAQIRNRENFHRHDRHDLLVQLIEGEGQLKLPDRSLEIEKGDWIIVPRTIPHQFINTGEEPARAIVVRTPPVTDDRFPASREK